MPQKMKIDFRGKLKPYAGNLKTAIAKLLLTEGVEQCRIEVVPLDSRHIADLNQRFRGVLGATDVLSFLSEENPLEGEIYICLEEAEKTVSEVGGTLAVEVNRLALHGILHLLGHHHSTDAQTRKNNLLLEKYLSDFELIR